MDPLVRHYVAQSPDAAQRIRESKTTGIFQALRLYAVAKEKKGENPFDVLLARYALDSNLHVCSQTSYIADMLDWAEAADRSTDDFKLAITKIDSLLDAQTANYEFKLEINYAVILEAYHDYQNVLIRT